MITPRPRPVIGPSGLKLQSQVLETNARVLIAFLEEIPKDRHLCLEEGTRANWPYEVLTHVQEINEPLRDLMPTDPG